MKAAVISRYGDADVLEIKILPEPVPVNNELRVKVNVSSVTATDPVFRSGKPFVSRLFSGLLKPKYNIPGEGLAGTVDMVGPDVTAFRVGDLVYGITPNAMGAHAEYKCIAETDAIVPVPKGLSLSEVVPVTDGAITALPFLRDEGKIKKGQKVLIIGASGSIGTYAVQLAKYFGAEVTGVSSTGNLDLVSSLGADHVIDYTQEDYTQGTQTYDLIFDTVGKSSFKKCKAILKDGGRYLNTVPTFGGFLGLLFPAKGNKKKNIFAATGLRKPEEKKKDLELFNELFESDQLKTVLDRTYELDQISEAHRYVETGHKKGNVLLKID